MQQLGDIMNTEISVSITKYLSYFAVCERHNTQTCIFWDGNFTKKQNEIVVYAQCVCL